MMVLLTFRAQIPSGSLELRVQHDVLLLAENCGCLWLGHFFFGRALEDRERAYYLNGSAALACLLCFAFDFTIFV